MKFTCNVDACVMHGVCFQPTWGLHLRFVCELVGEHLQEFAKFYLANLVFGNL
jgi:hypothetical protein